jgi:transcriptional regulator with XRE-family HTH domain
MQESDTDDDRDEFLSRLGVVLQLARKQAGLSPETAAGSLSMSAAAIGRWEAGTNKISGYDLVRLIRLYDMDPDLAVNPPTSKVVIRRRLGKVSAAARRAVRRGLEQSEGDDEPS